MSGVVNDQAMFRQDMGVSLIDYMANDRRVIKAAQVSTLGEESEDRLMSEAGEAKFIDFLMEGRHGSPFEHCEFTFLVEAPIFVFRELMRHRIASYNEESGRYRTLRPSFYLPAWDRNIVQVGKPGEYRFEKGSVQQLELVWQSIISNSERAYGKYMLMLDHGIAREVARMVLPVNLFSSAYVTINARSLMNVLSLRVKREDSMFPSFPQREIEMVAEKMEDHFRVVMPLTHASFEKRGRVAP